MTSDGDGITRARLIEERLRVAEALALLPPAARATALSRPLDAAEERILVRFLEVGGMSDGAPAVLLDTIVLDEHVTALLSTHDPSAVDGASPALSPTVRAVAASLERDLLAAESEATRAGWLSLAEQAHVGVLRARAVQDRIRREGGLPEVEPPADAPVRNREVGWLTRVRESDLTRRTRVAIPVVTIVAALVAGTIGARREDPRPDPRQAIGAQDFSDIFALEQITITDDRFAAIALNWDTVDPGSLRDRVDSLCKRLDERGFGAGWLYDPSPKIVARCGREVTGHGH